MNVSYDITRDANRAIDALDVLYNFLVKANDPKSVAAAKAVFLSITRTGSLNMVNEVGMKTLTDSINSIVPIQAFGKQDAIEKVVALKSVYEVIKRDLEGIAASISVMENEDVPANMD